MVPPLSTPNQAHRLSSFGDELSRVEHGLVELLKPVAIRDEFVPGDLLALDRDLKSELQPSTRRYYNSLVSVCSSDSSRAVVFGYGYAIRNSCV